MTELGKSIITSGIIIFTGGTIAWIVLTDWRWFAGGGAVFLGCVLSGIIMSIETKNPSSLSPSPNHQTSTSPHLAKNNDPDPDPDWIPPNTPAPDKDPFSK